ncbi:MAG: hypothetical protein BGO49_29960 [Planctomycetales bacterium 71-10]|nr:MAG: hypothetical protein BGO49_29960 [Planctomycetales bacterium 71-10]
MDTSDRPDSMLPARPTPPAPPVPSRGPASFGGGPRDLVPTSAAPALQVDPVSILRGLLRNWWKILGLWLILSAPLAYLVYSQVKPKYMAYSRIMVQLTQPDLFGGIAPGQANERTVAIETEMGRIRTDRVINDALGDATVSELPFIKNSMAPQADLLERLVVTNQKNTNYVVVSLELNDPEEAALIVNAVVAAYLRNYKDYKAGADKILRANLKTYLDEKQKERKQKEKDLAALVDSGVDARNVAQREPAPDRQGEDPATTLQDVSMEELRTIKAQLLDVQIELMTAKSRLQSRTQDYQDLGQIEPTAAETATLPEEEVARRIEAEFRSDPMIADLYGQKQEVERRRDHVQKGARKVADPSRVAHDARLAELQAEIEGHWRDRYHDIRRRVLAAGDGPMAASGPGEPRQKTVQELKDEVSELESRQASLQKVLDEVKLESKESNSATYQAQFLQNEIRVMVDDERVVNRKLQELEFSTNKDMVRVEQHDPAVPPKRPSDDKRLKLMAAVPVGVLAVLIGLFSLLEIKAERVGNPDALSTRVQSEVYSLPPIPMARSPRRLGAPGEDDQIDRFIQRLDHLRFAVCGDHPDVGLGRCVLISSAVGGEGKTTLAAQLAARCGHSGHATLLIDADVRRGALSPLLDVPEGAGLSDALMNDGLNVEELAIPVQGGTFHLLSAGTPTSDTSRLFQGRAFGMLIARLRQLYDLIIIDSPPILPVPDALIMGRWTDGVVLASRFDVSRAPQVERARRQLDLAGIPVLGTVINGMRTSDSYYGRYTYSRQQSDRERPAGATPAD